jgi:hypothetical protein
MPRHACLFTTGPNQRRLPAIGVRSDVMTDDFEIEVVD